MTSPPTRGMVITDGNKIVIFGCPKCGHAQSKMKSAICVRCGYEVKDEDITHDIVDNKHIVARQR